MPGDITILEGPVTPAPLFAYRAIRSIFFASPDSPEHYNYNKENIVPVYATSPTKTRTTVPKSPQTTPMQKRKRDELVVNGGAVLSPTKGILRTPGLATPRAKSLRDVNVKFKSVSPEVRRANAVAQNNSPSKPKAQEALQAVRPAKSTNDLAIPKQPAKSEVKALTVEAEKPAHASSICPLTPATIEAYMAQTEKEMKRLIRYGKKMREYALKKDAENQELTIMIDDLRRENERLRLGNSASSNNVSRSAPLELTSVEKEPVKKDRKADDIKSKAISPALRNKNRGYVREEVDRVETTVNGLALKDVVSRHRSSSSTANPKYLDSQNPSAVQRACSSSALPAATPMLNNPPYPPLHDNAQGRPLPSVLASNQAAYTGTLRLAPDRAAAARERIRKRTEARKASGEIGPSGDNVREDVNKGEPARPSEEQSDLWANL